MSTDMRDELQMCKHRLFRCLMSSKWFRYCVTFGKWSPRSLLLMAALLLLLTTTALMVTVGPYSKESQRLRKFTQDSYLAMSWEGFGAEKGVYNFTVVTAMLDIGRGHWPQSRQIRTYNTYLLYMQRVLRLDVNMVVYVDSQALPFVLWMRRGRETRTRVVETTLHSLPYYEHRGRIQAIMNSQTYQQDNELVRKGLCESRFPEYDILQWSKLHFLNRSITQNPFKNDFYIWLDGGYGHGEENIHPADGVWRPMNLFEHANKVTLIERSPVEKYRPVADRLHKMSVNIVAGGFVAGGRVAIQRVYRLQQELIADWMIKGVVDDDQTAYLHIYYKHPEVFRLVRGDWDDVFRLFHVSATRR